MTQSRNSQSAGAYRPAPPTPKEREALDLLTSMMGEGSSQETVLAVLRRNAGNLEKAAAALLEGETADPIGSHSFLPQLNVEPPSPSRPRTPPPSRPEKSTPVIDLTKDDDQEELKRALELSMVQQGPTFGPSDRAPDPNWAVVPSNVEVKYNANQEQESLDRAIQASLSLEMSGSAYDELPLEQRVRHADTPICLRPTQRSHIYAALILHALYFVPQVRATIASWYPLGDDIEATPKTPLSAQDLRRLPPSAMITYAMLETFVNMELARTTELNVDPALDDIQADHWNSPAENLGDLSFKFYTKLAWAAEAVLHGLVATEHEAWPRLFHFRYGRPESDPAPGPFDKRCDMSIVKVDIRGTPDSNDLVSCLSSELLSSDSPTGGKGQNQVIFYPSDVVAFQLSREFITGNKNSERHIFAYPKSMHMDQFLKENYGFAMEKRKLQKELTVEIEKLNERKLALSKHDNRDVLQDLRSSLHYYEQVAEHDGDEIRKANIQSAASKLRKILSTIENELQVIDTKITEYKSQVASIYDCPELQKYKYDLRAVLVHDGLYGRAHLYSYVKQHDVWWKTMDYTVQQVTEEMVLNDSTGLHMDCGPFLLIYSRATSPEEDSKKLDWPVVIKDSVKWNNNMFVNSLPENARAAFVDPNSPPSTPTVNVVEMKDVRRSESMSSMAAGPPSANREDSLMDLS